MVCSNCNKNQAAGDYCTYCGNKLSNDTQNNDEAIRIDETPSNIKIFFIRVFFSCSLVNFFSSLGYAFLAIIMLLVLPLAIAFGADVEKNLAENLPYILYSLISFALLFVSTILLNRNSKKHLYLYLCPNCNKTLSTWGFCNSCNKKYNITPINTSDVNKKSTSGFLKAIILTLYMLSTINLVFVCAFSVRIPFLFNKYSVIQKVLILIYLILSFVAFFALSDWKSSEK